MKALLGKFLAVLTIAAVSLANAPAQDEADKPKKPQRPPAEETRADKPKPPPEKKPATRQKPAPAPEKKADAAPERPDGPPRGRGPKGGPPQGRGPGRPDFGSEEMRKVREQMRGHFEEIQKLRQAGKNDEAEKKMAELRKMVEAMRGKFGGGDRPGRPPMLAQRGPGQGKGKGKGGPPWAAQRGPGSESKDQPKMPDGPKPPAKPADDGDKQTEDRPHDRKGPPHHDHKSRPGHDRGLDARDREKSKWAQHRKGPGAHHRPAAVGNQRGGPQMMKLRMAMMKRMAMARSAWAGKGGYGFSPRRGPGNWGGPQFTAPFMRGPWAAHSQANPKMRMMMAKRAATAKAGKPGKAEKKAKRSEKRGKKGRGQKECEKCKESGEKKDA